MTRKVTVAKFLFPTKPAKLSSVQHYYYYY